MSTASDVEKALPSSLDECQNQVNNDDARTRQDFTNARQIPNIPMRTSTCSRKTNILHSIKCSLSRRSCASVVNPGPPPDGGYRAWLQAFMGHLVVFNTWGMIATFGVFQSYYTQQLNLEPSAVSWIGTLQMLGHFSLGLVSGRLFDGGFFYWSVIPGMTLSALGIFLTSLSSKYWQLILAQGVMNGIGNGLQFAPCMSLVATYFTKHRSVAFGVLASGSATGGLVYPTIARQLLPRIGFAWTLRIMGFIMLVLGSVYCCCLRPRLPPRKSGPMLELRAFTEPAYCLFCIGIFLVVLGSFSVFYYISPFAIDILGLPYSASINLLLLVNGIGVIGRLIPSYFADKYFGPFNMLIPCCSVATLILFLWPLVKNEAGAYAFSAVFGFFIAGFQGLFPVVLTTMTGDLSKVGTRNGQGLAFVGIGVFVGPPISGALIQTSGGGYFNAQMFAGSATLLGTIVLVFARMIKVGWKLKSRV